MPPLHLSGEEEQQKHRHEKDGLQLKGKAQRNEADGGDGTVRQRIIEAPDGESAVNAVALAPVRAVEHHGGEEERHEKGAQNLAVIVREQAGQAQHAPGQHDIKENAEQLDEIEVADGAVREEGEEIQIRNIVVSDVPFQTPEASLFSQRFYPTGQKILIIQRLMLHANTPQHHGRQDQRRGGEQGTPAAQRALRPQDHKGQHTQHQQTEICLHAEKPPKKQKRQGHLPQKSY